MSKKTKKKKARAASLQGQPRQAPEHGPLIAVRGPLVCRRRPAVPAGRCRRRPARPAGRRSLSVARGRRCARRAPAGSRPRTNEPARRSMPAPTGAWHERLVALLELPVVDRHAAGGARGCSRSSGAAAQNSSRLIVRSAGRSARRRRVTARSRPLGGRCDGGDRLVPPLARRRARGVRRVRGRRRAQRRCTCSTSPPAGPARRDPAHPGRQSVAWLPDGSGFLYTRYPEDDQYNRKVFRHRLGADRGRRRAGLGRRCRRPRRGPTSPRRPTAGTCS